MVINLRTLPRGHSVITQDVLLSEQDMRDAQVTGAVACTAEVENMESQMYLRLRYGCNVTVSCSRCLREFDQHVEGRFRLILKKLASPGTPEEDDEAVDFFYSDDDVEVDVRQALYEDIMTNLPLKPLCSVECPGVEPAAEAQAEKHAKPIDPRWEALRRLREKNENRE
jgi:uncharacterized protein